MDDDPILLKIVEDMLGRKGVSCATCMNIREVVTTLGQLDYDMVLTDVQMPDTDGFGLLKLLRNSDIGNSRTIPVAVMTARGDGNTGIYEKEGFAGCIHKPFNIHALLTFYQLLCLKQDFLKLEILIFLVCWIIRTIMDTCCFLLSWNQEKKLRNLEQP